MGKNSGMTPLEARLSVAQYCIATIVRWVDKGGGLGWIDYPPHCAVSSSLNGDRYQGRRCYIVCGWGSRLGWIDCSRYIARWSRMDILHSIYRDSVCGYVALGSRAIQTCSIYYSFTPYTVSVSPHLARKPELSRSLTNFFFFGG